MYAATPKHITQPREEKPNANPSVPTPKNSTNTKRWKRIRIFFCPIHHKPTENPDLDNVEQASLETQLTSSNVGFKLLQKMGWKGKGLGKNEQGTDIIRCQIRIGKQEQDDFFTAEENVQRKKLDVELEGPRLKKKEVCLKVFYCDLCNKQYKLAMEFEAHLSSYDHNHRKRFKEMKEMHGSSNRDDRQITPTYESATALEDQDQRKTLKFGFFSRAASSKNSFGAAAKKSKVPIKVSSVFGNDSDEE
ncbi:hypothetical protein NE237_001901 [Protea cynaroides]|uniref:G-patch domain-containing protein n=1 Tax=Protea cynaroides TaxID=273540 RepID=A0A9Q0QYJ4_9MAGN|nr:hypothetical protein NE237_001901 [Protea cynaroides]